MLYDCLKIIHILSATLLLTSIAYSCHLWQKWRRPREAAVMSESVQTQTWMIIIPIALIQLVTGFTMISLKQEDLSQTWIVGSVLGFVIVIGSWFSFIYFLLQSQQISLRDSNKQFTANKYKFFRRAQSAMLIICMASLLSMIFLMANKADVF